MPIFKKIILAGMLFVFIGLPAVALAADPPPALNPMCWKAKECSLARKQLSAEKPDEGWVKNNPPCTGGEGDDTWGMCLPPIKTVTEISFGGTKNFENIGVFILAIYKYAVGVASVLAAVMIIIAGTQWATSGGNTETISSAKKRITGAIIGLFIALMSNFILNSINPALVNLRLPQVWMIKKQSLIPEFCSAAPSSTKFAVASEDTANQKSTVSLSASAKFQYVYTNPSQKETFWCGKRFFMENGGSATCWGDVCKKQGDTSAVPKLCARQPENQNNFGCIEAFLVGNIDAGIQLAPASKIIKKMELWALCSDGSRKKISDTESKKTDTMESYIFKEGSIDVCGGKDKTVGFYIGAEVTDCNLSAATNSGVCVTEKLAVDDWFAIGRTPGANTCDVNLLKSFFPSVTGDCSGDNYVVCSCRAMTAGSKNIAQTQGTGDYFISYDELKQGFKCNISVSRDSFPSLNNGLSYPTSCN